MFHGLQKLGSFTSRPELGAVIHFVYDAKGKDHLPIWDRFPLCIPSDNAEGGFIGLNLHYVPISVRHYILNGLMENSKRDNVGRVRANYNMLKTLSMYDSVKPCIKRYLLSHVQSQFLVVSQDNWATVLNAPSEKWVDKNGGQIPERGEAPPKDDNEAHAREVARIQNWGKPEKK